MLETKPKKIFILNIGLFGVLSFYICFFALISI